MRMGLTAIFIGLLVSFGATKWLVNPDLSQKKFVPSGPSQPFDGSQYKDFKDYISQTRAHLQTNKVYMDLTQAEVELDAATPYEIQPSGDCQSSIPPKAGILLIHGLSDMPFAVRDLANSFSERCFLVRTILLPGHGTRAADLLTVTRHDWLNAARFGIETLKQDVDQVYIGGFSLGGLVASHIATEDPKIKGVFALSPALKLGRSLALSQTVWLRYLIDWLDTDEQDDYARYESMPTHGLAEAYLLSNELESKLGSSTLNADFFIAQSMDDPIIDPVKNLTLFQQYMISEASRILTFQQNPPPDTDAQKSRGHVMNSFLPEQKIAGFSHQSIHISPTNAYYGKKGSYRNCGTNSSNTAQKLVEQCLSAEQPWQGEVVGRKDRTLNGEPMMRLTYNPLYLNLFEQIDQFIIDTRA